MHTALANSNDISELQGEALSLVLCYGPRLDLSDEALQALDGNVKGARGLARHDAGGYVRVKVTVPLMDTSQAYRILEVRNGHIGDE